MYKRLFTFGCSFTRFGWPTWADIMAWDLAIPNQNWGLSGLGNVGIFHRLVECDLKNRFTEDDLIVILWSHWHREDRYIRHWQAHGNIFQEAFYDNKFISRYWSLENDIIKNSTAIISANKMYNIAFQSNIMPLLAFESNPKDLTEKEQALFEFYKQSIPDQSLFEYNTTKAFDCYNYDDHPTVLQHLNFLRNQVYPSLNLEIKDTTVEICNSIHEDIINLCPLPKNKDIAPILTSMIKSKYNLSYRQPIGF
jgi:hypothetical protein